VHPQSSVTSPHLSFAQKRAQTLSTQASYDPSWDHRACEWCKSCRPEREPATNAGSERSASVRLGSLPGQRLKSFRSRAIPSSAATPGGSCSYTRGAHQYGLNRPPAWGLCPPREFCCSSLPPPDRRILSTRALSCSKRVLRLASSASQREEVNQCSYPEGTRERALSRKAAPILRFSFLRNE
jgi:hypothetical protein